MHLNDSRCITLHIKIHSIRKSKFRKLIRENTIIIALEINRPRLQMLLALYIKKQETL